MPMEPFDTSDEDAIDEGASAGDESDSPADALPLEFLISATDDDDDDVRWEWDGTDWRRCF